MSLIAGLLNGTNKNYDHQITALAKALLSSSCVVRGVGGGLQVTTNQVATGEAFILCTRTNGQKVMVHVELTEAYTISTSGTKKVYIVIDQAKLDDGSANVVDGSGIASIGTLSSYPSGNYVALASITGGTITDARVFMDENTKLPLDIFGVANNGNDTYTITPIVPVTTLKVGQTISFLADVTNNGASSVAIVGYNSGTPIPIKKRFNVDTADGDIPAGAVFMGKFDGTNVQMLGMVATAPSVSIGTLTEYTDPDGDEWDIVEKPDGSQFKVRGATRREMPKPPALYAIGAGAPVMMIEGYTVASNKSAEQTNTAGGADFIGYSTTKRKESQLVTMPTGYGKQLSKFTAKLRTVGSPTGSLTCKVYSDQGITLVATSSSVLVSTLSGSYSDIDFTFPNKELLAEGSQYYFTIETTQADSTSNYVEWGVSSTNLYSNGNAYNVNSAGAYALYGSNLDFAFSLWTENTPGSIIKATKSTGFLGVLKKAVSAFGETCNIQPTGNVKGLDFGTETEVVSATVDLNQTTQSGVELQVYSGQADQLFAFLTGENVGNLSSFDVYIAQNGTGGGILTANVHECTGYGANMAVSGASLGSAVINSPTSGVNTFTPGSAIALKPNTWYIIKFTSASGNSTNRWDLYGNNSSGGSGANGTGDGARTHAYWSSAWQYNAAPYLVTRYTSKINYSKGDFAYLGDTAGVFDTCRKANNPIPVGRIIDQNNLLLEKYSGGRLLGSASYSTNNTTYYRGSVPIPKNCSRVRIEVDNGTNACGYFDFNISEMGTDRTIRYLAGGAMATATLNLHKNYIRAISPTGHTFTIYFYQ